MTTEIVYIDRSTIKEGQVEEVRERIQDLVPFIEEREPQLVGYQFFFDEDARRMTVVAIHPDSDSLVMHMEIGRSAFAGFADFIDMKAIEVYGNPTEKVLELLEDKAAMLGEAGRVEVHTPQGGFMRLP
ncbi:MAG: hypothetical protein ACLFRT_07420 [Actinomycetota bacterium]